MTKLLTTITVIGFLLTPVIANQGKFGFLEKLDRELLEERCHIDEVKCKIDRFCTLLAWLESRGNHRIDGRGYLGAFQLSRTLIRVCGNGDSREEIRNSLELQKEILLKSFLLNKTFGGKVWKRSHIHESGLFGGSHLCGIGGLKKFLTTGTIVRDGNGVPITKYISLFKGFKITEADITTYLKHNFKYTVPQA